MKLMTVFFLAATIIVPERFAGYRSWQTLSDEPHEVPYGLAAQCMSISPEMRSAQLRQVYGPHADRWVLTFANRPAKAALTDERVTVFPHGAVLIKEKLRRPDDRQPEGVGVMVKHADGTFAASGGWEFLYYPSGGAKPNVQGCVDCHRIGGEKDYVFGTPR